MMTRAQTAVCTAVSPMSGSPTYDIDKKTRNGANLRFRHALRAGGVIIESRNHKMCDTCKKRAAEQRAYPIAVRN